MDAASVMQVICGLLLSMSSWLLTRAVKKLDALDEKTREHSERLVKIETQLAFAAKG